MKNVILYTPSVVPPICEKEIFRYAGVKEPDPTTVELMQTVVEEAKSHLSFRSCYCELPVAIEGDSCRIGGVDFKSKNLSNLLEGCDTALVFAATIGVDIDRLIMKYSRISPSKALMLQAFGTERIEALCDTFCRDYEAQSGNSLTNRFSAGYGDFSINHQKEIFEFLNCQKLIGLTLNDSFLMTPTKSVTAICGISQKIAAYKTNKCSNCQKTDCLYRG